MIVVIQCSSDKHPGAFATEDGNRIKFVAHSQLAKPDLGVRFQHPGEISPYGETWRDYLVRYNQAGANPYRLHKAALLYKKPVYRALVASVGIENIYILSAGWGLVRGSFLLPDYDITFSLAAKTKNPDKYRAPKDPRFEDFNHLDDVQDRDVVFFGSSEYRKKFLQLTREHTGKRVIFEISQSLAYLRDGCSIEPYDPEPRPTQFNRKWPYLCAQDFIDGKLPLKPNYLSRL